MRSHGPGTDRHSPTTSRQTCLRQQGPVSANPRRSDRVNRYGLPWQLRPDRLPFEAHNGPQAVLVDLEIPNGFDGLREKSPNAEFRCSCSQFTVAAGVGAKEIQIQWPTILAKLHDNSRSTAKPAFGGRQKVAIHQSEGFGNYPMFRFSERLHHPYPQYSCRAQWLRASRTTRWIITTWSEGFRGQIRQPISW